MEILKPNSKEGFLVALMSWESIPTPHVAIISERLAAMETFTTFDIRQLVIDVDQDTIFDREDVPDLSESEVKEFQATVDEGGIICVGQTIRYGQIIASKLKIVDPNKYTPEQKLLSAIFGKIVLGSDFEIWKLQDEATVLRVDRTDNKIIIHVSIRRPIRVGDILIGEKRDEVVVGAIVPQSMMPKLKDYDYENVDMVITPPSLISEGLTAGIYRNHKVPLWLFHSLETPGATMLADSEKPRTTKKWDFKKEQAFVGKLMLYKKEQIVENKSVGYGISERSSLSSQILEGIKIRSEFINLLIYKGLDVNMRELLTIKSDDKKGYNESLRSIINQREPSFLGGIPISVQRLQTYLKALGFQVVLVDSDGKKFQSGSPESFAAQITDVEVLPMEEDFKPDPTLVVTVSDILNYSANTPIVGGLQCEKIFGPLKGPRDTFGYIKLALPIIHPFLTEKIESIVAHLNSRNNWTDEKWEEFEDNFCKGSFFNNYFKEAGLETNQLITFLPVIPAGVRSFFYDNNKSFYQNGLDVCYRRVIIRNNRVGKLIEIKAPTIIIINEFLMLQESVNELFNGSKDDVTQRTVKGLKQHLAEYREMLYSKKVSYSGRGTIVPDSTIEAEYCSLPFSMAVRMFEPLICAELMRRKVSTYTDYLDRECEQLLDPIVSKLKDAQRLVSKQNDLIKGILENVIKEKVVLLSPVKYEKVFSFKVLINNDEAIKLHPKAIETLELSLPDHVIVHLPLSVAAQLEAQKVLFPLENLIEEEYQGTNYLDLHFSTLVLTKLVSMKGEKKVNRQLTRSDKVLFNID